jgi:5-methylcytosine-specific restriction endonuclease McrA
MRYWVIKGKPSENDFDEILVPERRGTWHTGKPRKNWAKGDRLFFWESSPAKRLVGLGVIRGIRKEKDELGRALFDVKYLTSRFDSPLPIDELRHYFAGDLPSFLKPNVAGTVFTLTNVQGEHLFRLVALSNHELRSIWPDILLDDTATFPDIDVASISGVEGRRVWATHLRRERDQRIVEAKKRQVLKETGRLECEVCGFDFEKVYGDIGRGFCEAHHIKPLSENIEETETKLEDLAVLCSNCHRMIHRAKQIKSVREFKEWLRRTKSNNGMHPTPR